MKKHKLALVLLPIVILLTLFCAVVLRLRGILQHHYRPGDWDRSFALTPEGDALVFTGDGHGGRDLYLLNLRTSQVVALTDTPEYEGDPAFSPDGRWLVYVAGKSGERADHIFLRARTGTDTKQITFADSNDSSPLFSHDGGHILFVRSHNYRTGGLVRWGTWAKNQIYTMDIQGQGEQPLVGEYRVVPPLSYSPQSRSVVCESEEVADDPVIWQIFISDTQSLIKAEHAVGAKRTYHPALSPNGMYLAYMEHTGEKWENRSLLTGKIHTPARPLLQNRYLGKPVFSPDGKRIYFLSYKPSPDYEGNIDGLWEIEATGANLRRIADGSLFRTPLKWQP